MLDVVLTASWAFFQQTWVACEPDVALLWQVCISGRARGFQIYQAEGSTINVKGDNEKQIFWQIILKRTNARQI